MGALIDVVDLFKTYGEHDTHALAGVNLSVDEGEFVALMGPSGCGKSTLLNIIGAIDSPTSGRVTLGGVDLGSMDDGRLSVLRRERIGFVFQFFNLLSTLTVSENVALPLALAGRLRASAINDRVADWLDRVGVGHRADFYPASLSGGEMQRVAIARALVHEPKVVLADEPTGNLDTDNGRRVLELLASLSGNLGSTIVMATHSEEAAGYASRVVSMRDGRILAVGGG